MAHQQVDWNTLEKLFQFGSNKKINGKKRKRKTKKKKKKINLMPHRHADWETLKTFPRKLEAGRKWAEDSKWDLPCNVIDTN